MADKSKEYQKYADDKRKTYEFQEGQQVPVGKTTFTTFKTQPGAMDDPGVKRAQQNVARRKKMMEDLD